MESYSLYLPKWLSWFNIKFVRFIYTVCFCSLSILVVILYSILNTSQFKYWWISGLLLIVLLWTMNIIVRVFYWMCWCRSWGLITRKCNPFPFLFQPKSLTELSLCKDPDLLMMSRTCVINFFTFYHLAFIHPSSKKTTLCLFRTQIFR